MPVEQILPHCPQLSGSVSRFAVHVAGDEVVPVELDAMVVVVSVMVVVVVA